MAGPSGLKLGGLVVGMCPNILMKEFLVGVAKRKWAGLKMATPGIRETNGVGTSQ